MTKVLHQGKTKLYDHELLCQSILFTGRLAWGGVDWIRLAQDRDRWRAVVSAVMNLRVLPP
jgi:hypothetical protein